MYNAKIMHRPAQRLNYAKKDKEWRRDNVNFGDTYSMYHNEGTREDLKRKIRNLNLYNGLTNVQDIVTSFGEFGIDPNFIPQNIPHVPVLIPKIELLIGEELKRRFDWKVVTTNQDAISAKEEELKQILLEHITEFIKSKYTDKELEQKLNELNSYVKYSWSDAREKMAATILKYYWEYEQFKEKFSEGFKGVFIFAEEIYQVEILSGEPKLTVLNPMKVHTVQSGNSDRIEDSQIIIIEDHWSPGKIVDIFYDKLKPEDIDGILTNSYTTSNKRNTYVDTDSHLFFNQSVEEMLDYAVINGHTFSKNFTDPNGNIRVLRVYWKSLKKIKKIKYYDENGDTQYKLRSEEYIVDKAIGEEETILWVNEWWEGTKIGKDLYINMKPMDVQYNSIENPSYCHPGIIGQIYNTNQGRAVSLIDRAINLQYLYDVIVDRTIKAIAANHGKILELDLSKIPSGWEVDKWMHFAFNHKVAVVDSFKPGTEGPATGKLAGGMTGVGGRVMDLETGNYIQQHIMMLNTIKQEIGEITGVSQQRQGQIENRETVGGVERAVTQSSHITEYWFYKHEQVKLRVLRAFLEAAKYALKGKSKKVQYILDEYSIQILNIDGEQFNDSDYDILVTNSQKFEEFEQTLKRYGETIFQTTGSIKTLMDIWLSPSISEMRRKIEEDEDKRQEAQNKQAEDANKIQQEQLQHQKDIDNRELDLKEYAINKDAEVKLALGEAKLNQDASILNHEQNKLNVESDLKNKEIEVKKQDIKVKAQKQNSK